MGHHVWRGSLKRDEVSRTYAIALNHSLSLFWQFCKGKYQDEWTTRLALIHREHHGYLEVESPQARGRQGDRQPITSFFTTAMEITAGTWLDMNS